MLHLKGSVGIKTNKKCMFDFFKVDLYKSVLLTYKVSKFLLVNNKYFYLHNKEVDL